MASRAGRIRNPVIEALEGMSHSSIDQQRTALRRTPAQRSANKAFLDEIIRRRTTAVLIAPPGARGIPQGSALEWEINYLIKVGGYVDTGISPEFGGWLSLPL